MTLNLDSKLTKYIEDLHVFIDWTKRWGSPRTARQDAVFYETMGKIAEGEVALKPFVHALRSTLESFFEDYRKELRAKEKIGNEFLERASKLLEQAQAFSDHASEEDKQLNAEIMKLIKAGITNVNAST